MLSVQTGNGNDEEDTKDEGEYLYIRIRQGSLDVHVWHDPDNLV